MRALVALAAFTLASVAGAARAADGDTAATRTATPPPAAGIDGEPPLPRGATRIDLVNPGFETPPTRNVYPGWTLSTHAFAKAYLFARDENVHHGGNASMRITRNSNEPWGMVTQTLKTTGLVGHTVRFSAWLRIDKASGEGATVLLRSFAIGAVDQVADFKPEISGTQDWRRYEVSLPITGRDTNIEFGALMHGDGTLWVDDASLVVMP
jgi:hypothetical protein